MKLQHAQLRGEGASTEGRGDGVLETEAEGAAGPRERLLCRVVGSRVGKDSFRLAPLSLAEVSVLHSDV